MKKSTLKLIFTLMIVMGCITLSGCNTSGNDPDQTHDSTAQKPPKQNGIKPIIYYHGKHYKISDKRSKLPQGFADSKDKIIGSEASYDTVPNRECYTTASNADRVGAEIFSNPNDDSYIYIYAEGGYLAFCRENI